MKLTNLLRAMMQSVTHYFIELRSSRWLPILFLINQLAWIAVLLYFNGTFDGPPTVEDAATVPEAPSVETPSVKRVPRRIYPPMEDVRLIKRAPYTDWKPSFPSAPPVVEKHDVCTPDASPSDSNRPALENKDDDAYQAMMDDCVHRLIMEEELEIPEERKNDAPSEPSKPTPEKKPTVKLRLRKGSSTKVPMVARIPSALDDISIKKDEKQT